MSSDKEAATTVAVAEPTDNGSNVFLSWSGERSKRVALALRERLPDMIQSLRPWMSDADIAPGERWAHALEHQLESNSTGILCLTPENLKEPWLLFEAGALSKQLGKSRVTPYLVGLKPTDVPPPLGLFQSVLCDREVEVTR